MNFASIFESIQKIDSLRKEGDKSKDDAYQKILKQMIEDPNISKKLLVKNILSNCPDEKQLPIPIVEGD